MTVDDTKEAHEERVATLEAELRSTRERLADVTAELTRLRQMHDLVVATTTEGVWVIDAESRTTSVNARMADMLGYQVDEMIGRPMFDFMDDEGKRIAAANVERRKKRIGEEHDFRFQHKGGRAVWTRMQTAPTPTDDGSYTGAIGLVTDVTEQRAFESEQARLWSILDRSLNEIYLFNPDTLRFEYVNEGASRNLGYPLAALREMTPLDLKPDLDEQAFGDLIAPLRTRQRDKVVFETVHRRRDGSRYPVEVHLQLVEHGAGAVFLALISDISERRRAQSELLAREERFRLLIERSSDATLLTDETGQITFASPTFGEVLARPSEWAVGRSLRELIHEEDRDQLATALANLVGEPENLQRLVLRVEQEGGGSRILDLVGRNLLQAPSVAAIVWNSRDVTEQRQLEAQMVQANRLESIGRLAGGVAHDFNNMLTAILGYAELLELTNPAGSEDVREIRRAGERARDLTQQLLTFARRQVIAPRAVDLNEVLTDTQRLVVRLLGEDIEVSIHLQEDLWLVRVDASQIGQVLLNLAVNARDAMPRGGKLTIETTNVYIDRERAARHAHVQEGEHVALVVSDNGSGIAAKDLPYVFEPFYTTKGEGEGTGLGLATVYGVVKQCGGHITVNSEVGVGTTFKVYFPRAVKESKAEPPRASLTAGRRGDETVLLVEDDPIVRKLSARALEQVGYRVLVAESPAAALAIMAKVGGEVDLLLTDVVMPGLSGKELADRVTAEQTHIRVLYVSGYTRDTIVHHGVLDSGVELLAKPFTPSQLQAAVRRVLDDGTNGK